MRKQIKIKINQIISRKIVKPIPSMASKLGSLQNTQIYVIKSYKW